MKSIDDLTVTGRRVLVRLDLNVPMSGDTISDDGKIRACLPTLTALLERGAAVIACSHLWPAVATLTRATHSRRSHPGWLSCSASRCSSRRTPSAKAARSAAAALLPGLLLLENLRFSPAETSKDDSARGMFADQLADLADEYVGDGFGAMHRRHASVYDVPARLPHAAGYLVLAETAALAKLTSGVRRPYAVVLGGAKVTDKLPVVGRLAGIADQILIGGAMANSFLAAQGLGVGASAVDGDPDAARSASPRLPPPGSRCCCPRIWWSPPTGRPTDRCASCLPALSRQASRPWTSGRRPPPCSRPRWRRRRPSSGTGRWA